MAMAASIMCSFSDLSDEIVVDIFALLNPVDLVRCRRLSKRVLSVYTSSKRLEYLVELAVSGWQETRAAAGRTTEERLARLCALQDAYKAARFQYSHSIVNKHVGVEKYHVPEVVVLGTSMFCFDRAGGPLVYPTPLAYSAPLAVHPMSLGQPIPPETPIPFLQPAPLPNSGAYPVVFVASLSVYPQPAEVEPYIPKPPQFIDFRPDPSTPTISSWDETNEHMTSLCDRGYGYICMNVRLDAIAMVVSRVGPSKDKPGVLKLVVLSLRTGCIHPESAGPFEAVLNPTSRAEIETFGKFTQATFYGHLLVYEVSQTPEQQGEIVVVDWTSGVEQTRIPRRRLITGLQPITETALLAAEMTKDGKVILHLYRWEPAPSASSTAELAATFCLPEFANEKGMFVRPATFIPNSASDVWPDSCLEWFAPLPETEAEVIGLSLGTALGYCPIVIAKRAFMAHALSPERGQTPAIVPWDAWGPQHARVVGDMAYSQTKLRLFGSMLLDDDYLYDFNQRALSRDLLGEGAKEGGDYVVGRDDPTYTPAKRGGFAHDVVTHLPYRATTLDVDEAGDHSQRSMMWTMSAGDGDRQLCVGGITERPPLIIPYGDEEQDMVNEVIVDVWQLAM